VKGYSAVYAICLLAESVAWNKGWE